jgi:hypothetical protein
MQPKPLVYIAGPYSSGDPVHNTHYAVRCATNLLRDGRVTPFVPHLTLLWHAITPLPYELWCAYDLEILARCDAVLRLPGPSDGADEEVFAAHRLDLPVFEDEQALLTWADQWDPLRVSQDRKMFVVATLAKRELIELEVLSQPPTFRLRQDQVALVTSVDGDDWAEFLTTGDLLAHCADALGIATGDQDGPYDAEALATHILQRIDFSATATFNDSRTEIAMGLVLVLPYPGPWPSSIGSPDVVATALGLEPPQGARLIDALLEVAAAAGPVKGGGPQWARWSHDQ